MLNFSYFSFSSSSEKGNSSSSSSSCWRIISFYLILRQDKKLFSRTLQMKHRFQLKINLKRIIRGFHSNLHESENQVVITRLTLFDWGVQIHAEEHLTLVLWTNPSTMSTTCCNFKFHLVRKKKEPHDSARRNLVVEGLAVQVNKRWVHLDVIPGFRCWKTALQSIQKPHFIFNTSFKSYLPLGHRQVISLKIAMGAPVLVVPMLAFFTT